MISFIVLPILFAFLNRVRGGLFGDRIRKIVPFYGTTIGRLIFASGIGISVYALSGVLALGALTVGTVFLGHAIAPFAPFQFMSRSNDTLIMSLRGVILTGATGVATMVLYSPITGAVVALSGLLMGPVYKLAALLPLIPFLNDTDIKDKNDTAEVLFGAVQGLVMALLFMF